MKLAIVTARLPNGSGEAFLIPEIRELQRLGAEFVVIPLRRAQRSVHRDAAGFPAIIEPLASPKVIAGAAGEILRHPVRAASTLARFFRISRGAARMQMLAAAPKLFWLAGVVRKRRIDHVHAYWASTVATIAMGAAEITSCPWSFTAHRYEIVSAGFLDAKARSAAFVRSISRAGIAAAELHSPEFARRARLLHLGVHVPAAAHPPRPNGFIVLSPAAFRPVKGHDVLIDAFARLLRHRADARLLLAGEGELRNSIELLVESRGLVDRVSFLGPVPHEDLMSLYAEGAVHVVALASYDTGDGLPEGIPVSLMEAMAHGLPVVATDAGGTAELLGGGAGVLVPQRDPAALAAVLRRIAEDPEYSMRLGRLGRARVTEEFDVRRTAAEFLGAMERRP